MQNTTPNLEHTTGMTNKDALPNPKVKKLTLRVNASQSNLAGEIKRMFNMAKSSGQELDLTFC
jgi:hypothetical protein